MNNPEITAELNHVVEFLTESSTFHQVKPEVIRAVAEICSVQQLQPGITIHRPGEPYKAAIWLLRRGEVEVRRPDGDSYRVVPGDFIGLSNYLDASAYSSTAIALSPTEVLAIPAAKLHALEEDFPAIYNVLNRFIARRIRNWSPVKQAASGTLARSVRGAMRAPLSTCDTNITLQEAYEQMLERKIGSLGVLDGNGKLLGMLTARSIAEAIILSGAHASEFVSGKYCEQPFTIAPDAPLWKAQELQNRNGVKYLIVVDESQPVGMLSQTDIVRSLVTYQTTLSHQIEHSETLDQLGVINSKMGQIAAEIRESHRQPSAALRVLSDAHLALQKRCTELTLSEMMRDGLGEPLIPYAVIIMGSGGRREMMLEPDQDNGIILADTPETESSSVKAWFDEFADRLNQNLDAIGYELCKGDIMARNPMFHKSLSQWRSQISHMAKHPNQKAARWSNIVFDFDTLHGDDTLTVELRKHVHQELKQHPRLLSMMVEDDAEGRPPIGWFNRLVTSELEEQKGKIDIKRNGLRIIGDATRIFALAHDIHACNTVDRLNALLRLGVLSADFVDSVKTAYEELIDLLLVHQIFRRLNNRPIDKVIDPVKLTSTARETLRESMLAVKRFQDLLQGQYGHVS